MFSKKDVLKNDVESSLSYLNQKFVKRIVATPPGICPVAAHLSFLQTAKNQSCGKCVPCRDGLEQLEIMLKDLLNCNACLDDFHKMKELAEFIKSSSDCALGYDVANVLLKNFELYEDEYISHVENHKCSDDIGQKVPCITSCPANVDIPAYISLISEKRYADAINVIRNDNPFPTACAFICEHPCETKCRRTLLDSPVNIRGLKRFAVDQVSANNVKIPECNVDTGKKIAIVGGGPSGLTAAYFLSLMGHKSVIFEKNKKLGGMLRYGIPNYRLPKNRLDEDIKAILSTGKIKVKLNTNIEESATLDNLMDNYDAVYMSIGAQGGSSLSIKGIDAKGVFSAVEMLNNIGNGNIPNLEGKRVVVIGGGNVAVDTARSVIRSGAKSVVIAYRRRQEDMTAFDEEIQSALEEGVELFTLCAPKEISVKKNGHVRALVVKPQIASIYDKKGRPSPKDANEKEFEIPCDVVYLAIGQTIESDCFSKFSVNEKRNNFEIDDSMRVVGFDKLFSGGDCAFGPTTVIKAIGAGKAAAENIDAFLGAHHKYKKHIDIPDAKENYKVLCGRANLKMENAKKRKNNFKPVEIGLSNEEAMQECRKCLRCDKYGCGVLEGGK